MLITLPIFIHKALWDEIGYEFDHVYTSVRILDSLIQDYWNISCQLNIKIYIVTVICLTIHLPEKFWHRGEVVQYERWKYSQI
jgi:hypothetical protein